LRAEDAAGGCHGGLRLSAEEYHDGAAGRLGCAGSFCDG
jgi:hypothetical protein